jgi:hypothetical protein
MPHIISRSYCDTAHPLFKKKGTVRYNSPEKDKDDKKNVPRSYDSVKEAAGAREPVQLTPSVKKR